LAHQAIATTFAKQLEIRTKTNASLCLMRGYKENDGKAAQNAHRLPKMSSTNSLWEI